MKKIEKKVLPEYYKEIRSHRKMFELRKDDSDYKVGDILILREWDGEKYTGTVVRREITYILRNCPEYGLMDGYCILSLQTPGWDSIIRSPIVTLEGGGEMDICDTCMFGPGEPADGEMCDDCFHNPNAELPDNWQPRREDEDAEQE